MKTHNTKLEEIMTKKIIAGFIFAVVLSFFTAAASNAAMTIKLAHPNVPATPMGQAYELFKQDLEKRSDGFFKVQIYDSSKYGNFDAVVQGISMGVLQMGSDGIGNFSVFNDDLMLYDMPFLFPSYESCDLVEDGPIGQELAKSLEKQGIMGLGYIDIGYKHIFSNRPVRTLEDAKDLKIRSTHSKAHIAVLQALGMNPTPIAWGEVYTTLQQGTVDGIDIDLNLAYFNKFHEITKYVTLSGTVYTPHLVLFSKRTWDKLSPEQQGWIMESFKIMQDFERKTNRGNEEKIIAEMKKLGVEVIELSPEERARWVEATKPVYEKFADQVNQEQLKAVQELVQQ